jgi:hypothetical protein
MIGALKTLKLGSETFRLPQRTDVDRRARGRSRLSVQAFLELCLCTQRSEHR